MAALCAAAMLASCGAGGGSDSGSGGVVVVPTPSPTATASPVASDDAQAFAAAEARGELPTLDRTSNLAGADTNGDRIRDDLATYIASRPFTEPQKAALRQAVRAYTQATVAGANDQDKTGIKTAHTALSRAIACIYARFPIAQFPGVAADQIRLMREFSANTRPRVVAFMAFSDAMTGSVITIPGGDTCE